jgi:hypothetical protein
MHWILALAAMTFAATETPDKPTAPPRAPQTVPSEATPGTTPEATPGTVALPDACERSGRDTLLEREWTAGVKLPPDKQSFGESALAVGADGVVTQLSTPDHTFSGFVSENLPPTDRGQWRLVLFWDSRDPESKLLKADLERNESLRIIRDWCLFTEIDRSADPKSLTNDARILQHKFDASGKELPTLLVFTHPDHPTFGDPGAGGWEYAFERSGYGGDAGLLARDLYQALYRTYQQHGVAVEQCPGPYCPVEPDKDGADPWNPAPPNQDDWAVPPLPVLPVPPPRDVVRNLWDRYDVWIVGAVATVILIIMLRRRSRAGDDTLAGSVILLACLCSGSAIAGEPVALDVPVEVEVATPPIDEPQPPEQPPASADSQPASDTDPEATDDTEPEADDGSSNTADGRPNTVEQAYMRPPIPPGWTWMQDVVSDAVNKAFDDPRHDVQGLLLDNLITIRNDVSGAIAGAKDEIESKVRMLRQALFVSIAVNVLTLAGVVTLHAKRATAESSSRPRTRVKASRH